MDRIQREKCIFCGEPAKRYQFAVFICDSDECMERAFRERGGPAGHKKNR